MSSVPPVFVFGSNLAGRHGAGAALWARRHRGAVYGQGIGWQGNAYAIPTKGWHMEPLSLAAIQAHAADFIAFALAHPELEFELTPVGCGLAGYTPWEIAPLFRDVPSNVRLPGEFRQVLSR